MGVYNVHGGHNSIVPGTSYYLNEVTEDRKVKNKVISLLKSLGNTVYDCTDDTGSTQGQNLANIVAKCNAHSVDLDISIHLNAGGGTGAEVYYYAGDSTGRSKAAAVSAKVAAALGIRDRGAKSTDSLYVLNKTRATAILVECCFVGNTTDQKCMECGQVRHGNCRGSDREECIFFYRVYGNEEEKCRCPVMDPEQHLCAEVDPAQKRRRDILSRMCVLRTLPGRYERRIIQPESCMGLRKERI